MNDCIFCKIAKGEVDAHIIYEDEKTIVFLDKHPIQLGHSLVVPKVHEPDFYRLDESMYQHLMGVVKKIAGTLYDVTVPEKVGLIIAGFDVPHTHVHVVPMHDYHDITSKSFLEGNRANPSDEELAEVAQQLKKSE